MITCHQGLMLSRGAAAEVPAPDGALLTRAGDELITRSGEFLVTRASTTANALTYGGEALTYAGEALTYSGG